MPLFSQKTRRKLHAMVSNSKDELIMDSFFFTFFSGLLPVSFLFPWFFLSCMLLTKKLISLLYLHLKSESNIHSLYWGGLWNVSHTIVFYLSRTSFYAKKHFNSFSKIECGKYNTRNSIYYVRWQGLASPERYIWALVLRKYVDIRGKTWDHLKGAPKGLIFFSGIWGCSRVCLGDKTIFKGFPSPFWSIFGDNKIILEIFQCRNIMRNLWRT